MPAPLEDLLQQLGGVAVLAGQHPLAAGHQGDLAAHGEVGAGELRAGDAGPDDDQVLRQLGQVVELPPVEDPLAVRLGAGHDARVGAGGDEHHVGRRSPPGARRRP